MLSYLEKTIFFVSLMTIMIFIFGMIDFTEYGEVVQVTYITSVIGSGIVSVLNFIKFFKELIK